VQEVWCKKCNFDINKQKLSLDIFQSVIVITKIQTNSSMHGMARQAFEGKNLACRRNSFNIAALHLPFKVKSCHFRSGQSDEIVVIIGMVLVPWCAIILLTMALFGKFTVL